MKSKGKSELIDLFETRDKRIAQLQAENAKLRAAVTDVEEPLKKIFETLLPVVGMADDSTTSMVRKATTEVIQLRAAIKALKEFVAQQAEDKGLWFIANTCSEGYLQQELRKLHSMIEDINVDA